METAWQHLSAAQPNEWAAPTEQRGPHTVTGVDCVLVAEVYRRAAAKLVGMRCSRLSASRSRRRGFADCARSTAGATLGSALHRWRSLADITETRVIGDARRATAEKGERSLEAAADALAGALALDDVHIEHDS